MVPMQTIRRKVIYLTAGFLTALLIMWLLTPYKAFIAGIILGLLVSLYNVLYLARRVRLAGESTIAAGTKKVQGTGMINRFLMAALAVIVGVKYPQVIDVRTIPLGLPICYILIVLLEFWQVKRESIPSRKG